MRTNANKTAKNHARPLTFLGAILLTAAFVALNIFIQHSLAGGSVGSFKFLNTRAAAAPQPQLSCITPPSGMVTWLPGDGNAQDILNNAQDLSINGGVTFSAGKVAQAFNFDGTGDVTYSTINAGSAYTVDFWMRPTGDGTRHLLANNNADAQSFGGLQFDFRTVRYRQGGSTRVQSGAESVPLNTYTHVALTYNGSVNRLYINGSLIVESVAHTETFNNAVSLGFAIVNSDGISRFMGQIDEVEIFNRELSPSEILSIVSADSAGKCKTPVDADGDGVVDSRDACPGTPLGTLVNAAGCPLGACFPPPTGMTNWFPGDGNANDIRGSNNGTLNGAVTFSAGKVAQAFNFNGTSEVTYSTINAGSAYTVDFWVRPTGDGTRHLLANNNADAQSYGGLQFDFGTVRYRQGGSTRVQSAAGSVPLNTYTHVALIYDGSVNGLYINGNLVSTSAVHTETFNNPVSLGFAIVNSDGISPFLGQIDEVEIFSRALSQTELRGIVNADNAGKCTSTRCSAITLNPATLPAAGIGTSYNQSLTAIGGTSPYTFAITNGSLPPGLSLNSSSGQISGTATTAGTFNFGITATDASGCPGSRSYSITVTCPTITVSPSSLPDGTRSVSYNQTISASGTPGPFTFSVPSGALPPGLSLSFSGELSGTPTTTGTFNFTVAATAATCSGSRGYTVTITCATITVSPSSLATGTTGVSYNQAISASGTPGPFTFSVTSGALPPGLSLSSSTGQLSGTPTTAGSFNFTVAATDTGCSGSRSYTLTINDCAPVQQGLVSWWRGEGNASDSAGSNNGVLNGTVSFTPGQVGQAFSFNGNGYVEVPNSTTLEPGNVTAEAWVRHNGSPGTYKYIVAKGSRGTFAASYAIYTNFHGGLDFYVSDTNWYYNSPPATLSIWDNQWHHVVGTFDGATVRLYVDGVQIGNGNSAPTSIAYNLSTTNTFKIGAYDNISSLYSFLGDIDEVRIYNRALSLSEVRGNFGHCEPAPSPSPTPTPNTLPGNNVSVQTPSGDASATFTQVNGAGETLFSPINPPSSAGTLPPNYSLQPGAPAYEIHTTASYTAPVTVCLTIPSINNEAEFARVRILHGENGPLVDRTILAPDSPAPDFVTRRVCARVNSLSPFVAALAPNGTPPPVFDFSQASLNVTEEVSFAVLTVNRTGDTSAAASVDFTTADGTAIQRTDYTLAAGTVNFAAGEASKTFRVLISEDAYVEGDQSFTVNLSNPVGGNLGTLTTATVTIVDDDTTSPPVVNPIDNSDIFVRQHYHDFLAREGDSGGLVFWTGTITGCGTNQTCINGKRIDVSNAFYYELEFQQTGSYVYRVYRAAFGNNQPFSNPNPDPLHPGEEKKVPLYLPFMRDRARVRGGVQLAQLQLDFATVFVQRPEFVAKYPLSLATAAQFVDALLATMTSDIPVDLSGQRQALIDLYNQGSTATAGRANVLYRLADDNAQSNPINNRTFIDAEYNRAFVFTQYAGYLRRNADMPGFLFWLGQVNSAPLRDVPKQHAMVCSFITAAEYQNRFSSVVTYSNAECQ